MQGWRSAGIDLSSAVVVRPSGRPVEGLKVVSNYGEAGPSPKLVILGCKPQQLDEVVARLTPHLTQQTVVVSILALFLPIDTTVLPIMSEKVRNY